MYKSVYRWLRKKVAPGETYPECPAVSGYAIPDFFEVSITLDTTLKDGTYVVKEEGCKDDE